MQRDPRILPLGDTAFTATLDAAPSPATTARLARAATALRDAPGVLDVAAAFRSLTVHIDPLSADRAAVEALAVAALASEAAPEPGMLWKLPVCFEPAFGPDQEEVAAESGQSIAACVEMLTQASLTVLMVGFLPGFPFCGPAPQALALPRKRTPRLRVPAGSVAVANGFAGVYPWESPGGWRILGNCPVRLFDPVRNPPALLAAGDSVQLVPVSAAGHANAAGLDPLVFRA